MTTKHTPSPWHTNNNFGNLQIISEEEKVIARLLNHPDDEIGFKIAESNAKLIAAAPDLLEALIDMVQIVELLFRSTNNPEEGSIGGKARAAIAKATA